MWAGGGCLGREGQLDAVRARLSGFVSGDVDPLAFLLACLAVLAFLPDTFLLEPRPFFVWDGIHWEPRGHTHGAGTSCV